MLNPLGLVRSAAWRIAAALRESGQALERTGCRLQGIYSHEELLHRHTTLVPIQYSAPSLGADTWVAPSSVLSGAVGVGSSSSIWYNAVVRGDFQPVSIGHHSNIQDGAIVGAASEYSPPTSIGNYVSVGHGAVIKGAAIGDHTLIGINAVISEGCQVGGLSIVAAGAYVEENTIIPPGEVWAGNPAKKLRDLKPAEREYLRSLPERYSALAGQHSQVTELLKLKQEEFSG